MKHKGKKVTKHRLRQLQVTQGRDEIARMSASDMAIVHPEFYKYLVEEGYINDKGTIIRSFGELFKR